MPIKEALFGVGIAVLGAGLAFLAPEHPAWGWPLMGLGLVAVAYAVYAHYHPAALRPPLWGILLVLTWGAIAYDLYDRHQSARQQTVLPIFKSWGTSLPDRCAAVLNGSLLVHWSSKYDVGYVCGIKDSFLDQFEDTGVTFSQPFSIHPGDIEISAGYSNEMKKKLQGLVPQRGTPNSFAWVAAQEWYEPVLYPRHLNRSDIHKLSDIQRYGGVLISQGLPKP